MAVVPDFLVTNMRSYRSIKIAATKRPTENPGRGHSMENCGAFTSRHCGLPFDLSYLP